MDFTKFALNAGELSDELAGRPDLQKVQMGCELAENVRVLRTGGMTRRAGFGYAADVYDNNYASRLKGFRISSDQGYVLEFSNLRVRIFKDAELVESGGSPVELVTPWTADQVFALDFAQRVNRIIVAHPDVPLQQIALASDGTWSIEEFPWQERIWETAVEDENELITLTPAATTGSTDITSSAALFDSSWVGTRLQLEYLRNPQITRDQVGNIWDGAIDLNWVITDRAVGELIYELVGDLTNDARKPGVGLYGDTPVIGARAYWRCISDYDASADYTGSNQPDDYPTFFAQGVVAVEPVEVRGTWSFETFGIWTGTYAIERSYDGGSTWNTIKLVTSEDDNNEQVTDEEDYDTPALFRVLILDFNNTTQRSFEFVVDSVTIYGVAEITAFNSATNVDIDVEEDFEDTVAALSWKEDAFNPKNGYAATCTFHQKRLWLGGSSARPQFFWASRTEAPYDFTIGTLATDGMSFQADAAEYEDVRWIISHLSLLVATSGGVWAVSAPDGQSITPESNAITRQLHLGAKAGIPGLPIQNNVLYLQDKGRKIQELTGGTVEYGGYLSADMTQLASHITRGGVTQMESGKMPDSLLYLVVGGELAVLTYERAQNIAGWARWVTDGTIESVGICPGAGEDDEIYISVNRNGERFIERLSPDMTRVEEDGDMPNLAFLDSFVRKEDANGFTVFDGLGHLEGREVHVFADGETVSSQTVSGGKITLSNPAANAIAGLPFTTTVRPMPLDRGNIGSKTTVKELVLRFRNTLGAEVSQDEERWAKVKFPQTRSTDGSPPSLKTGDYLTNVHSTWERQPTITIRQAEPLPMTLLAIRLKGQTSR